MDILNRQRLHRERSGPGGCLTFPLFLPYLGYTILICRLHNASRSGISDLMRVLRNDDDFIYGNGF